MLFGLRPLPRKANTLAQQAIDVEDSEAQFVRIVGYGNSANSWNSLTEVDIATSTISTGDVMNLALGKAAEQSSISHSGAAGRGWLAS